MITEKDDLCVNVNKWNKKKAIEKSLLYLSFFLFAILTCIGPRDFQTQFLTPPAGFELESRILSPSLDPTELSRPHYYIYLYYKFKINNVQRKNNNWKGKFLYWAKALKKEKLIKSFYLITSSKIYLKNH